MGTEENAEAQKHTASVQLRGNSSHKQLLMCCQ